MKITISNNGKGFKDNDLKFIKLLVEDEWLESSLISARSVSGVPEKGFDRSKPIEEYVKAGLLKRINYKKLWNEAVNFTLAYNRLPKSWIYTFTSLILFNIATPPGKEKSRPIEFIYSDDEVRIVIREAISRRGLTEYINKDKNLKEKLSRLPQIPKIKMTLEKLDNKKKIHGLSEAGKTAKEISDILVKGMPSNSWLPYDVVGTQHSRLKVLLNKHVYDKDFEAVVKSLMLQNLRDRKKRTN
jgi:hypothetical protein